MDGLNSRRTDVEQGLRHRTQQPIAPTGHADQPAAPAQPPRSHQVNKFDNDYATRPGGSTNTICRCRIDVSKLERRFDTSSVCAGSALRCWQWHQLLPGPLQTQGRR